jgi:hypothetical protein
LFSRWDMGLSPGGDVWSCEEGASPKFHILR